MPVNTATRLNYKEQFFKGFLRLFPHITQSMLLVLLQGCFERADIQFKRNNVV